MYICSPVVDTEIEKAAVGVWGEFPLTEFRGFFGFVDLLHHHSEIIIGYIMIK